jgi:hypothetical protein
VPPNNPLYKKIVYEVSSTQSKMIRYFINLMDDRFISSTTKLLDMLMFLLPQWIGVSYENLMHGKIKGFKIQ